MATLHLFQRSVIPAKAEIHHLTTLFTRKCWSKRRPQTIDSRFAGMTMFGKVANGERETPRSLPGARHL